MDPQRNEPAAPTKRSGARIGIGCLSLIALFSIFCTIILMFDDRKPNHVALGLSVFGVPALMAGGGAYVWYRAMKRKEQHELTVRHEKIVLQMAASAGGCATLAQVVQGTPLSSEEAERALEHLSHKGLVHYDLLDDGTVLYRFGGLIAE